MHRRLGLTSVHHAVLSAGACGMVSRAFICGLVRRVRTTERSCAVCLIRLMVALWLVTTVAAAQRRMPNRPRSAKPRRIVRPARCAGKKSQPPPATEAEPPTRRQPSRWQRFKNAVWPFRSSSDTEADSHREKRRSLLTEKVAYAPVSARVRRVFAHDGGFVGFASQTRGGPGAAAAGYCASGTGCWRLCAATCRSTRRRR